MFILKRINHRNYDQIRLCSSQITKLHNPFDGQPNKSPGSPVTENTDDHQLLIDWTKEMKILKEQEKRSVLEPLDPTTDDLSHGTPYLQPTFNLAAYVNKSETLQELLKLGVDLHRIEKRKGLAEFVLKLDFERDIKKHLMFLNKIGGVDAAQLGSFVTKNPLIFKESIDNMETRLNYLQSKHFQPLEISRILEKNPFWLMFRTQRIDRRLGFFQTTFQLSGNEVRKLTVKQPKLITYHLDSIRQNTFTVVEELGFSADESKALLLNTPKIWMMEQASLLERFNYLHNVMKIPHQRLLNESEVLQTRLFRIQQRHEYLQILGKAQYDPSKDLYVSLKSLVEGTNTEFLLNVARTSQQQFDEFLRQL